MFKFKPDKTYVFALGGLGEISKNMYCIMHNNQIIVIDAEVLFPDEELRSIDYVLPVKYNQRELRKQIKSKFDSYNSLYGNLNI